MHAHSGHNGIPFAAQQALAPHLAAGSDGESGEDDVPLGERRPRVVTARRKVLVVGLGGGQLTHFLRRHFPEVQRFPVPRLRRLPLLCCGRPPGWNT